MKCGPRRPATKVAGSADEVRLRGLMNRPRPVLLYEPAVSTAGRSLESDSV